MKIDGRAIAGEIIANLAQERNLYGNIHLGILIGSNNPAVESFVRIKKRVAKELNVSVIEVKVSPKTKPKEILAKLGELAESSDGIIVQLPLFSDVDTDEILSAIPKNKDVDAINPSVKEEDRIVRSPVAEAVREVLHRSKFNVLGKRIVVVGEGRLVGRPVSNLLRKLRANVVVVKTGDSLGSLKDADVVVLGAGSPYLVKPQHIKEGAVIIDAGTSEAGGKVLGDADPECERKASIFTPVPGGIGVAMIFKNLFILLES
jgi:methylenetetrahydrofolate dehydrogenase (NADP+) / methenyltetrahydrofolate cyclohydrolase